MIELYKHITMDFRTNLVFLTNLFILLSGIMFTVSFCIGMITQCISDIITKYFTMKVAAHQSIKDINTK